MSVPRKFSFFAGGTLAHLDKGFWSSQAFSLTPLFMQGLFLLYYQLGGGRPFEANVGASHYIPTISR